MDETRPAISIARYYESTYNISGLKNLPLVRCSSLAILPVDVCYVVDGKRLIRESNMNIDTITRLSISATSSVAQAMATQIAPYGFGAVNSPFPAASSTIRQANDYRPRSDYDRGANNDQARERTNSGQSAESQRDANDRSRQDRSVQSSSSIGDVVRHQPRLSNANHRLQDSNRQRTNSPGSGPSFDTSSTETRRPNRNAGQYPKAAMDEISALRTQLRQAKDDNSILRGELQLQKGRSEDWRKQVSQIGQLSECMTGDISALLTGITQIASLTMSSHLPSSPPIASAVTFGEDSNQRPSKRQRTDVSPGVVKEEQLSAPADHQAAGEFTIKMELQD